MCNNIFTSLRRTWSRSGTAVYRAVDSVTNTRVEVKTVDLGGLDMKERVQALRLVRMHASVGETGWPESLLQMVSSGSCPEESCGRSFHRRPREHHSGVVCLHRKQSPVHRDA